MKLSLSKYNQKIAALFVSLRRYGVFLFILLFLGIYTFLVLRVSRLVQQEPSAAAIETETVKRLRIDEESIDQIRQLEAQNIEVQALFEDARNNPFTE